MIQSIVDDPPQDLDTAHRDLSRLAATCPARSGEGIHQWLFLVARFLYKFPFRERPEFAFEFLRAATRNCERRVPDREIMDAVINAHPENDHFDRLEGYSPLPRRSATSLKRVLRQRINVTRVIAESPEDCKDLSTRFLLRTLFPDNPLLCFVYDKEQPGGWATRPTWMRSFPPLMVPSALLGEAALTQSGRMSARALANIGPRRYLVLDFDEGDKDDHATIIWHLRKQWASASVGLVMVLDSGKRSLHSWWNVRHLGEEVIGKLCRQACRLGADKATCGRAQLVRVPQARRPETKQWQTVYYFDERAIAKTKVNYETKQQTP